MNSQRLKTAAYWAIPLIAIAVFVSDLATPLGISEWMWYSVPLLLSVYVRHRFLSPFTLAAIFSVLILAGFFLSPPGVDRHLALISRGIGISVLGLMASVIWHLKRTEAKLSMLSHAVDHSPASIVITDKAGNIEYVNPKFTEVTGYSAQEVRGKNPRILKSGEMPPENYRRMWKTIEAGGEWHGEFHNRKKNGKLFWESAAISAIADDFDKITHYLAVKEDITPRKQAEETLARERNLLRSVFDILPDYIYLKDEQSRFILCNNRRSDNDALQSTEELIGKTDADFFPPELAAQFRADELAVLGGTPLIDKEETLLRPDGRQQIILTTKLPFRDGSGKIVGLLGHGRDITDRKRAEQELVETLDFNKKIISDASAGIVVFNASGQCVLANEFAAQTINATAPQILAQNFRQLETWRTSGMLQVAEEALATGKPQHCESHFASTFGKELWLVCHFTPFIRGDEPHLLLLFNDITGRKQAEEHIREQAALLDKAQDAILVLDLNNRITYWNRSAERIYGWTAAEAIGRTAVELLAQGVVTPQLANAIKTLNEQDEWVGELQEYTKVGKSVTVHARCNLIRDEQGRPKSRLIINTDITEKKNLEAQSLRSQRMEGIGALAGGIAHDLNNVLTPLLVAVQVLKEKVTDEDGRKLLQSLEVNVQRGAGLVKQVLGFGRGVTGERVVVHPKHIVREIKGIVHETFPKSVEFELHTAPDLWPITGDPTQLHQVLLNLCVNARDAMPKGGKLSLHMENVTFDETYAGMNPEAKAGPYVLITVTDTGTGIPKEIQDRIFDPFFTTKEPGKGTGLGLSTTLTIVKSHGGFIHCHSEPDQGATFKVYFPANPRSMAVEKLVVEQSKLPRGHNELVLVVDDEEPIRNLAQKVLERFGYRVLLAANGAEALSLYAPRQQDIAVVITDMVMPIMDGPTTITALKAIKSDVKIISSTGQASDGGLALAREAGVQHFVSKPYTAETMLKALDEVLHEHHIN